MLLAGCGTPLPPSGPESTSPPAAALPVAPIAGPAIVQPHSRWQPVAWSDLPGWSEDTTYEAWNAWLRSCERPSVPFAPLCADVRRLSIASSDEQRAWMVDHLQPYRVEAADGNAEGLLTGYYEPLIDASRTPLNGNAVPLLRPPAMGGAKRPWYTRQEIDTLPEAQAALRGREIAWVTDPLDALMLQIQGSGRLRITEADGTQRVVRVSYAGSNDQPYRSVGAWLLQQGARDATWPGIKAWVAANPQRMNELLWSNPRYVFFREEPLTGSDAAAGPRGAQGVPLTAGRSIAVDKDSIPVGTPVWLASGGPNVNLQRLVIAQDTGSAIVGAVRADFYTGSGPQAGELAG